jgi:hypothetical protein
MMISPQELSQYTDMTQEQLQECFERIDMTIFIDNPTQSNDKRGNYICQPIN